MSNCEFRKPFMTGEPACKMAHAILKMRKGDGAAFTPKEIIKDICENSNPEAREQCDAFVDLSKNGKSSIWCK